MSANELTEWSAYLKIKDRREQEQRRQDEMSRRADQNASDMTERLRHGGTR